MCFIRFFCICHEVILFILSVDCFSMSSSALYAQVLILLDDCCIIYMILFEWNSSTLFIFKCYSESDGLFGKMIPFDFKFLETGKFDGWFNVSIFFLEVLYLFPETSDDISNRIIIALNLLPVVIIAGMRFNIGPFLLNCFLKTLVLSLQDCYLCL